MGGWLDLALVERKLTTRFVGRQLVYLTRATSTQDFAAAEAGRGAPDGTVVIADEQTAGRGRLDRSWVSPPGANLYLTLVLRPPADRLRLLSVVSGLAVAEALERAAGLNVRLKWPNDVLVGPRKIAGCIVKSELRGDAVDYALAGIGVNVNFDVAAVPEIAAIATSVRAETGADASREEVLAALLNAFEPLYAQASAADLLAAWRRRLDTLGRRVRAALGDRVEEGIAEDVDAEGSLIVRRDDGSRAVVEAGEVTLRE
jgi:BirA family biotin operon repressor/biotin-[acetyl-CoA-carboxylase] ligase